MRTFILYSGATTNRNFDLLRLHDAGMDVVCACVANSLYYSNNKRDNVAIHVALHGGKYAPLLLTFDSRHIKSLGIDEVSIASVIKRALQGKKPEGINVEKKSFESFIKELPKDELYLLDRRGVSLQEFRNIQNPIFILGDADGIPKKTLKYMVRLGAKKINISTKMLFASQCITIVHHELDKMRIA